MWCHKTKQNGKQKKQKTFLGSSIKHQHSKERGQEKNEERSTHLSQSSQFRRSVCAVNGAEDEGEEGPGRKDDIILTPVSDSHLGPCLLMLSNIWWIKTSALVQKKAACYQHRKLCPAMWVMKDTNKMKGGRGNRSVDVGNRVAFLTRRQRRHFWTGGLAGGSGTAPRWLSCGGRAWLAVWWGWSRYSRLPRFSPGLYRTPDSPNCWSAPEGPHGDKDKERLWWKRAMCRLNSDLLFRSDFFLFVCLAVHIIFFNVANNRFECELDLTRMRKRTITRWRAACCHMDVNMADTKFSVYRFIYKLMFHRSLQNHARMRRKRASFFFLYSFPWSFGLAHFS